MKKHVTMTSDCVYIIYEPIMGLVMDTNLEGACDH